MSSGIGFITSTISAILFVLVIEYIEVMPIDNNRFMIDKGEVQDEEELRIIYITAYPLPIIEFNSLSSLALTTSGTGSP